MDQAQQNRIVEYAREELPSIFDYDHPVIFQPMQYFYYEGIAWVFNAKDPLPDGLEAKDVYYTTVIFRKEVFLDGSFRLPIGLRMIGST